MGTRHEYLSYPLAARIPAYGGEADLELKRLRSVSDGDSATVCQATLESHWGTHLDAPAHFFEHGREIADFPAEFWHFTSPFVYSCTLRPSEVFSPSGFVGQIPLDADLLLIQSGWGRYRGEQLYVRQNPGMHPDVALKLRQNRPAIRAIGIDWISVSPYADRETGRAVHRAFLDPDGAGSPILLMEDMQLSLSLCGLLEVIALPLRLNGFDSAPCTVVGIFND